MHRFEGPRAAETVPIEIWIVADEGLVQGMYHLLGNLSSLEGGLKGFGGIF